MQIVSLSRPQKITALIIFIGVVAIVVFALSASPADTPRRAAHIPYVPTSMSPDRVAPVAAVRAVTVETSVGAASPAAKAQATHNNASDKKIDAWVLGNTKSASPQIPLNSVIREYEVIEINQHPTQTPQVGETVSLPMLNGKKILVDVQTTSLNPNGDKSWSGHLQGYGEDYPIVMTYGQNLIFATITTPEGSYTMESADGVGWLYKNPSELELSDASSKDFLEIPHSL